MNCLSYSLNFSRLNWSPAPRDEHCSVQADQVKLTFYILIDRLICQMVCRIGSILRTFNKQT